MEPSQEVKPSALTKKMQIIANNYFIARDILFRRIELSEENFVLLIAYVQRVSECYEKLDEKDKKFINNDFFYQSYPKWWVKEFSHSMYMKFKHQAIKHFLEVFYVSF